MRVGQEDAVELGQLDRLGEEIVDARAVIATVVFGAVFYGLFAFAWPALHVRFAGVVPVPWHFLHAMFLTVWACIGFALAVNRVVFGQRAEFELKTWEKRQRILAVLRGKS